MAGRILVVDDEPSLLASIVPLLPEAPEHAGADGVDAAGQGDSSRIRIGRRTHKEDPAMGNDG
jgi:hypothetical protein